MMMRSNHKFAIAAIGAVALVLLLIGIALAAGGGDDDEDAQANATPTAPSTATLTPTTRVLTPSVTASATPDQPDETPIPVEPDGGIGNTPGDETPIPVEPDGGIGDGAGPIQVPPTGETLLPASDLPTVPADRKRVDAPIDGAEVLIQESFPPGYILHLTVGLPSGCAEQGGWEASRSGSAIVVKVYNTEPAQPTVCTAIYGIYELYIPLGSDYVSGQSYTVQVNDQTVSFTAQ